MAISYIGGVLSGPSTGGGSVVGAPTGTAAGDVLVAIHGENGTTPNTTTPTGWTLVQRFVDATTGQNMNIAVYTRVATGSDSMTIASSAVQNALAILTYRGADTVTPMDSTPVLGNSTSTTAPTTPGITVTSRAQHIAAVFSAQTGQATTVPAAMTSRLNGTGTGSAELKVADEARTAGATGTRQFTGGSIARTYAMVNLALRVTDNPPTAPGTPTVTPTPVDTTGSVAWTASSDADADPIVYDVELSTNNGGSWASLATGQASSPLAVNLSAQPSTTTARVRVRARDTVLQATSAWSTSALFTIDHNVAPNAPGSLSPAAGSVERTQIQRLSWVFSDPNAGDTQSKFDVQYRLGIGSWTTVTQTTTSQYWDAPANTFPAGSIEWQVRTYDSQGIAGPWSSSAFFTAATTPGAPTMTAPTSGATIATAASLVSWSTPAQESYQVRTVADSAGSPDTSTVYTDSGEVVSTTARDRALSFPTNSRYEHVQVRIKNSGLWSSWASVRVQISYTPPGTPTLLTVPLPASAAIQVAVTNPAGGTAVASNDLYRRIGSTGTPVRVAKALAGNATWIDYTPASGVAYEYQAVAVGTNGTATASAWTS